jgi:hypothetical protein
MTGTLMATVEWLDERIERGRHERFCVPDVSISPAVAQGILDHLNPRNRKPRRNYVNRFAKMMLTPNRWLEPESELKFGRDGKVNDGQTRLYAVVRAGRPVRFTVWFGCDPRAHGGNMPTGDWSAGEALRRADVADPARLGAIAKVLINIGAGRPWSLELVENDELLAKANELTEAGIAWDISAARCINRLVKHGTSIRALAAAIHLIRTTSWHAHRIDEFVEALAYGTNLSGKRNPILVLRNGFINHQWRELKQAGALVLAWNHFVEDRNATTAQLTAGSEFPEVV